MRIIFMGTPDFAVPSLDILLQHGFEVAGVITAPDRPSGRGLQLNSSPVKQLALSKGLKILQPTNLKSEAFLQELKSLHADLQVVVAFRMLPEAVWRMPPLGTINLHASLLPDYRGAAPINWAIINGEKETGLTTFFIEKEIDTGKIIFRHKIEISPDETAGELHDRMMAKGAGLILQTVEAIKAGNAPGIDQQPGKEIKTAPKIFKEYCKINWNQSTKQVYDFVRGLSPYPTAWTKLNGKTFKIFKATWRSTAHLQIPGDFLIEDNQLCFATMDGFISPTEVQLEGKKRMDISEFMKGFKKHEG